MSDRNAFIDSLITKYQDILVTCDDASTRGESHRGRVARIATLIPLGDSWVAVSADRVPSEGRARRDLDAAETMQRIRADGTALAQGERGSYDHKKLTLRCPLCGLDIQKRLTSDVHGRISRLQEAGLETVTLTALAAILF